MIKYLLSIIVFLECLFVQGQETILITKKFNGSKQISEQYYVFKSNHNIKHGESISYFKVSDDIFNQIKKGLIDQTEYIKIAGNYNNGKKEGKWKEYSEPNLIYKSGEYHNDQKVGIWSISVENGQVVKRFDYDINQELIPIVSVKLDYPKSARDNGIEGIVELTFHTNKDCTCDNITVTKSLSEDCDNEGVEAIKRICSLLSKYWSNCEEKEESKTFNFTLY